MKMTKQQVRARIREVGIVPVVRAETAELARGAADAVTAGGIAIVEIAMTVPGAVSVIEQLSNAVGDSVLIGAGTVLDQATAADCLRAGAQFLVSPGFDRGTVEFAGEQGVLMMAGALTPTEAITAWKAGSDIVKIFPAGNVGGPAYIKALKAALPQIPMIPTGGVNLSTAGPFLQAGAEALGVGGGLVSGAKLKAADFQGITAAAAAFLEAVKAARK